MRALLIPLALLLFASTAHAQDQDEPAIDERSGKPKSYETPQHFWFEFKIGPYTPGIDGEFGGKATPYKDVFGFNGAGNSLGDGKSLIFSWELEYEIWRKFGTLAVGGGLGYFSNSAPALVDNGPGNNDPKAARSGSTSTFTMLPLALLAVYRFDWLADRYRIPLVPYAKFGFNYTFWWMLLDGSTRKLYVPVPDNPNILNVLNGRGGSFGWQVNLGLAFRLDIIDPGSARALDAEIGINHTYLFFEFAHIAGFGAAHALGVGDTTWNGGIAFEF